MEKFDPAKAAIAEKGYQFGEFRLETNGTLWRGDTQVSLPAEELQALRLLLARQGQVVTALELKQTLWGDEPVPADSVAMCLASLRKRLEPEEYIQTVHKRGFRFSAETMPLESQVLEALPRLAILPFTTGFGVPEHLGPAIADEAADRLRAATSAFALVLARDSVSVLAGRGLAPRQIGEMLKADFVLAGDLHLVSSQYRLRVRMIRVTDGSEVWVEDRLVDRARLVQLETELARMIALRISGAALAISASAEQHEERESRTGEHEAYEIFLRARYEWQSLERHRMQDALQQLLRVIELDPAFVPARINLAYLSVTQEHFGFMPPAIAADLVRQAAEPAQNLDTRSETLLPALGWIQLHFDRDLPAALRSLERSAHLPHDPWITRARTMVALSRHRFSEAIEQLLAAIHVDPWSPWLHARLAWAHHLSGEAAASVQLARTALDRFPQHEGGQLYAAIILAFNGETSQALDLAQGLVQRQPHLDPAAAVHAYALAMAGRKEEARTILERLQWLGRERYAMNTFSSAAYVALGDPGMAMAELNAANERRCPWFFQMLADPRLRSLRARPDFVSMLNVLTAMEAEGQRSLPEDSPQ
ncbi:MAG TPA: winged helix-turn-helix domain-containing protein [Terracidiphilus sp.]|nr:winged helix-turn-helix domain-containing protein [Terracidiphilus sp.]